MTRLGKLATNSCRFDIDVCTGILTITSYRTGEEIKIDLTAIDEDTLEQIDVTGLESDEEEELY